MTEEDQLLLDAIKVDVDVAEDFASAKYDTLPNDNPFTADLQSDLTNYLEQAAFQHVLAYGIRFGLPMDPD